MTSMFPADGMASLIRSKDWSSTPLGARERWPATLRILVEAILPQDTPAILLWGPELVQIYNDGYRVIAAEKHPVALGQPTYECWPEAVHFTRPMYGRVLAGESVRLDDQLFVLLRRGVPEEVYISVTYSPVRDEAGAVAGILALLSETTARVRAEHLRTKVEAERRNLAERLSLALAAADLGTWDWDPTTDLITLSDRGAEFYGLPHGSVPTRSWMRGLIHPEYREPARLASVRAASDGVEYHMEYPVGPVGGEPRWVEAKGRGLYDAAGTLVRMLGVVRDITPRKTAEREREQLLRHVERERGRLTEMFARSPSFIAVLRGPDHVFEMANEPYLRLIGRRDIIGRPLREALPEVAGQGFIETLDRVLQTGKPFAGQDMRVMIQREADKPAEEHWLDFVYQPLHDSDGSVAGVFVHGNDLTTRKRAEEELREQARRKDEFLAMLAHELRNPLAPVRNALEVLKNPAVTPELQARSLRMTERQVAHMARLVDDLLEVSRLNQGKIRVRREATDLVAVLRRAVEAAAPIVAARSHELALSLPPTPVEMVADPTRLEQVFVNLLTNAAKYTPVGGRIWVEAAGETDVVTVRFRDSGVGIPPDLLPKVFDLFVQAEQGSDRAQGGLGIGLTLVKRLVELHGGQVEARSDGPNAGSEFVVRLPRTPLEPVPAEAVAVSPVDPSPGRRILVIDDNQDAAETMAMLLQLRGHDVRTAHQGATGLRLAAEFRPNVVILDIGLPGMDGYEVARRLRASPDGANLLIVALTGYGQDDDRSKSRQAGFDHHLVKPADPATLEALLNASRAAT